MLVALLVVPSTVLALDEVRVLGTPGVDDLRAAVTSTTTGLRGLEVVVAAADPAAGGGPVVLTPDPAEVHLGGLGLPTVRAEVGGARSAALAAQTGLATVDAHPGPDLAVLAVLAARAGASGVTLLALPTSADDAAASEAARALRGAATAADLACVVAGDLSAGHGDKPPRPEVGQATAARFDAAALDLLSGTAASRAAPDLVGLAVTAAARGLPGLLLAVDLAAGEGFPQPGVRTGVVDGVGWVACRW